MCINDSQNAMIIDEKDIAVGAELDVETVKNDTDKEEKFGLNVQVHSTPVSLVVDRNSVMEDNIDPEVVAKEYGGIDSEAVISIYKTEYGNSCFVHDLNNNNKFTVKSDGLVFGGPNILSTPLEGITSSSWQKR